MMRRANNYRAPLAGDSPGWLSVESKVHVTEKMLLGHSWEVHRLSPLHGFSARHWAAWASELEGMAAGESAASRTRVVATWCELSAGLSAGGRVAVLLELRLVPEAAVTGVPEASVAGQFSLQASKEALLLARNSPAAATLAMFPVDAPPSAAESSPASAFTTCHICLVRSSAKARALMPTVFAWMRRRFDCRLEVTLMCLCGVLASPLSHPAAPAAAPCLGRAHAHPRGQARRTGAGLV